LKKLAGNKEIEDSLRKLDKLTEEEARVAAAEHMRITRSVERKVMGVEEGVQDVGKEVQGVNDKVEDVGEMIQDVDERVQNVGERVQDKVQDVNHKLDQANRSSPPHSSSRHLTRPHREPAPRYSTTMAFSSRSFHQPEHCVQGSSQRYIEMVLSR
jgi:uncharacterized protein YoxC